MTRIGFMVCPSGYLFPQIPFPVTELTDITAFTAGGYIEEISERGTEQPRLGKTESIGYLAESISSSSLRAANTSTRDSFIFSG